MDEILKTDPLLDALVLFTKLYHKPFSADALTAGLPLEKGQSFPELFSIHGSKSAFSRAAGRAGLSSRLVKKSISELSNLVLPAILILKGQNACILERFNDERTHVKVIMPEIGESQEWIAIDEFEQEYIGFAFLIKKQYKFKDVSNNLLDTKNKHWFWDTLKLSTPIYRDVAIASFVINIFVLASPLFTMNVYDRVVPNSAIETMWVLAIGVTVVYALDLILKLVRTYFLESAAKKSDVIMSSILFEKVMDLKLSSRPKSVGSFANNLKDFDTIRNFLTTSSLAALIDLPFVIIFLFVINLLGGAIAIIPVIGLLIILIYSFLVKEPLRQSIQSTYEASAEKSAILVESLSMLETIKAMGTNAHAQWKWEEATGEISRRSVKSRLLSASISSVTQMFTQLTTVAIIIYGVYMIQEKELTMGALIAIVILSSRTIAPIGQVAALLSNFEQSKTAYMGLDNIVKLPQERPQDKQFVERPSFIGKIEFKDVSFKYPDDDRFALQNATFTINHGDKLGIIGKIGSGKSTIEKLILGLYEPTEGTILIDGIDISQIDPSDLRRNISYVPQDVTLFRGTVKENIVIQAPYANDAAVIKAAFISQTEDFVNLHPKGFDMEVGERGDGLSGGQRQSIAVARAFLVDNPLIIMDEPSNSMDNTTELRLLNSLKVALEDKTTILVTHKSTLLALVDRLLVIDQGRVVMDGAKEEVLARLNPKKKAA